MICEARQYSDQMHCHRCKLAWDINDPLPPTCLTDHEYGNMKLKEIKEQLDERSSRRSSKAD